MHAHTRTFFTHTLSLSLTDKHHTHTHALIPALSLVCKQKTCLAGSHKGSQLASSCTLCVSLKHAIFFFTYVPTLGHVFNTFARTTHTANQFCTNTSTHSLTKAHTLPYRSFSHSPSLFPSLSHFPSLFLADQTIFCSWNLWFRRFVISAVIFSVSGFPSKKMIKRFYPD